MDVYIYKNSDDNRVLNKTLYMQRSVIADIKGTCSITSPTLILSYQGVDFNYIYVPAWSRYYFVTDITVTTGGRVEARCKADVLMSNRAQISTLTCNIIRQENVGSSFVVDNKRVLANKKNVKVVEFSQSAINISSASSSTTNFVLAVAGR